MTDIEQYIGDLAARLRVGRRHRRRILGEVHDHLVDAVGSRERAGECPEGAVAQALDAFGAPAAIAKQFNAEAGTRAMRRAPVVAFTAGVAVFGGLLLAGRAQQRPAVPVNAILATQVSFFVAVLAFQIAIVAGICAASRALAQWRAPAVRGVDRQFVRRAAIISTGALGVAAAGWTTALGLALNRLEHPKTANALIGGLIMVVAAVVAIATTCRLRVNHADDPYDAQADARGLLSFGERTIAVFQRHPVISCAAVAAFSVWPAMAHAETTVSGALPWGIIQAVAVVIAFTVLGRPLELRGPRPT